MATLTPLLAPVVLGLWSVGSLTVVGGWCALTLRETQQRAAPRRPLLPPVVL